MMYLILCMSLVLCNRLLRLKVKDNLYVTNNNGTLTLEPSIPPNLPNQQVVIHKRVLYFFKDGTYYTMAMVQGGIELKLIVYNAMNEKDIGFLTNSMLSPQRRKVNPFAYLAQGKRKRNQEERDQDEADISTTTQYNPTTKIEIGLDPKPVEEGPSLQKRAERSFKRPFEAESEEYDTKKRVKIKSRGISNAKSIQGKQKPAEAAIHDISSGSSEDVQGGAHPVSGSSLHLGPDPKDIRQGGKTTADIGRHKPDHVSARKSHLIESDSKMEDHEFGYVIKNVTISEIDREHFRLVGKEDACVTYYKDGFVFMPCSSAAEQIFKLETSEDVIRRNNSKEPGNNRSSMTYENSLLDFNTFEDGDRDKDTAYKGSYDHLFPLKSLDYKGGETDGFGYSMSSNKENRAKPGIYGGGGPSSNLGVKKEGNAGYNTRNDLGGFMKSAVPYTGNSTQSPQRRRIELTKATVGVTQSKTPVQEQKKSFDYESKNAGKSQKLGFNDDFIDRFREAITNDDLNDFI